MTLQDPRNLDWISHNGIRSYPLAVHATGQSSNGMFTLPMDFIVGLNITLPSRTAGYNPDRFFISRLRSDSSGYTIYISYDTSDMSNLMAIVAIPYNTSMLQGTPFNIKGLNSFATLQGVIQIGTFETIRTQPPGDWVFDINGGRLDPTTCRITPTNVSAIYIKDFNELRGPYYGDVTFESGNNTRITETSEYGVLTVVIDAIDPSGFNMNPNTSDNTTPIRTINNVQGDSNGNIDLVSTDNCFDIVAIGGNIISFADNCSQPCCDCEELAVVTDQLIGIRQQINTINTEQTRLSNYIDNLGNNILGSRINDVSCIQCSGSCEGE